MKRKINLQTRFSFFNFLNTKNYSRITYVLGVLAATTLALSLPNCAESRKEKFLQGQGTDLQKLEELDGKEFVLNTSDAIGFSHNSVAKEVNISKEMNFQNFPLVAYSTDADLLGTVPFRGKANHQYKIRYQLNKHYLKILKIAPKTDLPFDELPYAEDLGNGEWAVPLVGYSIRGFYRIENQKNSYDRETQYLAEIPVFDPSKATHVKVDYFSHTIFDAVEKVDTYPSEVILGDWYLSVADTAISPKERMAIEGLIYAADKVRIIKRPSGYVVYNIANDENLDESQMHNLTPMFEIPAVWRDFQVKKHGSDFAFPTRSIYFENHLKS